jgi:hypothetical protein
MSDLIERLRALDVTDFYEFADHEIAKEAADEIERLTALVAELERRIDTARNEWSKSGAFDNYECDYGPSLGTCPESNDCWECQLHKALYPPEAAKLQENGIG